MKNRLYNLIALGMIFLLIVANISYAEQVTDKVGRVIYETISPTAAPVVDEDTISAAERLVADAFGNYAGPRKNIFSNGTMFTEPETEKVPEKEYTLIRHTSSIADLTEERYYLKEDYEKDRMRLVLITEQGFLEGKNGFFKIDGKTFYFDEEGLMVLGPCYDTIGNYYFFSYDTGELLEEIQTK